MQILSASDNTVRLHLSGSAALINSIKPDQVRVKVDLTHAVNGENIFTITRDNITVPPGLRLSRIEPSEVKVRLDLPITRELPIQVDWVGALPKGLILRMVRVAPDRITVVGGVQVLKPITTVYTERVRLDSLKESGQLTAGLYLEPSSLKPADGYKSKVEVFYTIEKRKR
jgi:YbbR domain-containing protein